MPGGGGACSSGVVVVAFIRRLRGGCRLGDAAIFAVTI